MAHKIVRRGVEIDLSVVGKVGCPKCMQEGRDRSRDNLHVYGLDSDGEHLGGKCFACNYLIPSEKWLEENRPITLEDMEYEMKGEEFNNEVHEGIKSITSFNSKNYRGITPETSRFFGVRYECDTGSGEIKASYYPVTRGILEGVQSSEAITGYKIRYHPKKFGAIGETGKESDLFGMFRFPTHKGIVVICAGEIDHLSAYQMLKDDYNARGNKRYDEVAVVSPTSGEGSINQFKRFYEWFNNFNKVIICYDNDKAGKIATEALAQVLPRGKVFVMPLRNKDVNEYVEKGMEREFISDFWAAKPYTPAGIVSSLELYEEALISAESVGISLPDWFKGVTKFTNGFGLPENEICVIAAQTSGGKTLFVNNLTIHWILNEKRHTVGVLSLEATAGRYSRNLLSSHLGVSLNRMSAEDRKEYLSREDVKVKSQQLFQREDGSSSFYILDDRGSDVSEIKNKVEVMVKKLGVSLLIIDPYSDLLSSLSVSEQEDVATWLKKLQKETGVTPIIVSHLRKGGVDEDGGVNEDSIMGSSFLAKASGTTIALERNKQAEKENDRNTTRVRILKNREHSETGVCGHVFFNKADHRLYDLVDFKECNPHLFVDG